MTPPASEQVAALEGRMTSIESDLKEIRLAVTRIESVIIGLDGKGDLSACLTGAGIEPGSQMHVLCERRVQARRRRMATQATRTGQTAE